MNTYHLLPLFLAVCLLRSIFLKLALVCYIISIQRVTAQRSYTACEMKSNIKLHEEFSNQLCINDLTFMRLSQIRSDPTSKSPRRQTRVKNYDWQDNWLKKAAMLHNKHLADCWGWRAGICTAGEVMRSRCAGGCGDQVMETDNWWTGSGVWHAGFDSIMYSFYNVSGIQTGLQGAVDTWTD